MADSDGSLEDRVAALEKALLYHLGPAMAASSMNIPHTNTATSADLTTLTARVAALEAGGITGAGRYL